MRWRALAALAIAAGTVCLYLPVREHAFVAYDDDIYVVENPNLRGGVTLETIARAFAEPYETNWIPLTWISYHVDYALYGLEPAGYLLANVALHAFASVLLFLALVRATGAVGRSAFVAAVFAAHPLHVQSVAWVAERKDALSGVFFMAGLLAYVSYAERRTPWRLALVAAALALGLLAKPMLVTFPIVLLLLDYWPLGRLRPEPPARLPRTADLRRCVVEKLPLFALALAAAVVTFAVQRSRGAMTDLERFPLDVRLWNALESYAVYVGRSVWPGGLAVFYPHPGDAISVAAAGAAGLALAAVTFLALRASASRPYLAVGWLFYLVTLLPVIGIVQVGMQARADRYMYLPLVGLGIAVAWGVHDLVAAWRGGIDRAARGALAAVAALAVAALAVGTRRELPHWRDTTALFERALAVTEGNAFAHEKLADVHLEAGRLEEAQEHYERAVRLGRAHSRLGLADVLGQRGRLAEALDVFERAHRRDPDDAVAAGKYGLALVRAGRHRDAIEPLEQALRAHPGAAELLSGLASASAGVGACEEAVEYGRRALLFAPDSPDFLNNLAWVLATCPDPRVRDAARAVRLAESALRLAGDSPPLLDTLAAAQASAGRFDDAVRTAERAARIASEAGHAPLAAEIRAHAALYRAGRPYVEEAEPDAR